MLVPAGRSPLALLLDEPLRDPLELRPPESLNLRIIEKRREDSMARCDQARKSIIADVTCIGLGKKAQRIMNKTAAVGGAQALGQGFERLKAQNFFGEDEIWIGDELLDTGDAQRPWPGCEGRRGMGLRRA